MSQQNGDDRVARVLRTAAETVLILAFGLVPIFFVPIAYAPFGFSKTLFVLFGVVIALVIFALAALREGECSIRVPSALLAFWGVVAAYVLAAVFSGDVKDAVLGDSFDPQTAGFMILLAVIMSVTMMLRNSKISIARLFILFIGSGMLLGLFHVTRAIFGPETLSLGLFAGTTASPYGSWNGLAIFFGLVLLIGMVASHVLHLTRIGKAVLGITALISIMVLALVGLYAVWIILAGVSLVVLLYGLTQTHYRKTESFLHDADDHSVAAIMVTGGILVVAVMFIIGGSSLSGMIANTTGISFVEVRPSHIATFDILKQAYAENPITGIGPNKFVDAWRLYKNPAINETIFWNTTFDAGSGFIPTSFVSTGVVGIVAWAMFFFFLAVCGVRMLFRAGTGDRFWNFIGTASFIATLYLWAVAVIYVPSSTTMIITAICTGVFLAAYSAAIPMRARTFSVASGRAAGIIFVGGVVVVIFVSVGALYGIGRHYSALYSFNKAFATATTEDTIDTVQQSVATAYDRSPNDAFARQIAQYRLAQVHAIIGLSEPTDSDREAFQQAISSGVSAAQLAIEGDPTEPLNWFVLGQLYSVLTLAEVEGAYDRGVEAFDKAAAYDPLNPAIVLARAQLESRHENLEAARTFADASVTMKRNYTDAIFFLSQIDIMENNVAAAIARTESIISIEPQNPARYYQLGVLHSSAGDLDRAIAAFEQAVLLDGQYANARYFLALGYAEKGRTEDALSQMRVVQELNPDNALVAGIITQLENGEPLTLPGASSETTPAVTDGQEVTSENADDTTLVTPVNTVPDDAADETETAAE